MNTLDTFKAIQTALNQWDGAQPPLLVIDGDFGQKSQDAFETLLGCSQTTASASSPVHAVKASSFADLADVAAFKRAKSEGMSDQEAFKYGDNGIGFTGIDCTDLNIPYVALPPDDWKPKWGTKENAAGTLLFVTINGVKNICKIGDTMPWKKNITNGAGIDLAPGAQAAFGLKPPFLIDASWQWAG